MIEPKGRGVLDRPVKPGDDRVCRAALGAAFAPKRKVPPFGGTFLLSLGTGIRINGRPCLADRASGPGGSDPAAAGRASGRRPAADRASGPGSGSADPGSGSA